MKSTPLNKSYAVLAGIVVVMIALVLYMWMDARRLQNSLSKKPEPLPELTKSNPVQTVSPAQAKSPTQTVSADPRELPIGMRLPPRFKRNYLEPGETVSGNTGLQDVPLQQGGLERDETVGGNGMPLGRGRGAGTSQTADWMFKTGKNMVETEDKAAGGQTPVPE